MSDEPTPAVSTPEKSSESPPSSRPKREGNESLWKRARRTLGTNSLTFLQPQSRPPGATKTSSGSGPAPPSKRREQVRHAQRTHRQRTQNYIKTLESEVVRLRESENNLLSEREKLHGQIELLTSIVVAADLPLPPSLETQDPTAVHTSSDQDFNMPAIVSYTTDELANDRLHVQWPAHVVPEAPPIGSMHNEGSIGDYGALRDHQTKADLGHDFSLNHLSISADSPSSPPFMLNSNPSPNTRPVDESHTVKVDTIQTAIEFVLALEHPCMAHIPYPANPSGADPAGHVMMMSAPLFARAPESPRPNTSWETSGAIIKELLNLSSSINLEGEITPVEAWHRLHQHPEFGRLDKKAIDQLKGELSGQVRCCGFGAVLDEYVFWQSLNKMLALYATRGRQ